MPTRCNSARRLVGYFLKLLAKNYLNCASAASELSLPIKKAIEPAKSVSGSAEFLGGPGGLAWNGNCSLACSRSAVEESREQTRTASWERLLVVSSRCGSPRFSIQFRHSLERIALVRTSIERRVASTMTHHACKLRLGTCAPNGDLGGSCGSALCKGLRGLDKIEVSVEKNPASPGTEVCGMAGSGKPDVLLRVARERISPR